MVQSAWETYAEKDSSIFLTVRTSRPLIEVFRVSTYLTAASTNSVTITVDDRTDIGPNDQIYIGTNAAVPVHSAYVETTGPGTITVAAVITAPQYASVVLKRASPASVDDYEPIYRDVDMATTITQPFESDALGQWRFFIADGKFGRRVLDSSDNTLSLNDDYQWPGDGATSPLGPVYAVGVVCDGTTDDTTAINTALAAGGPVSLPPGVCIIRGQLLPASNTKITGAGIGVTTLKLPNGVTEFASGLINTQANSNIEIENLTIDENLDNNTAIGDPAGIYGKGSTNIQIHNVEIKNMVGPAINFASTASEVNSRILVHSCVVSNGQDMGIQIQNARDSLISNNVVRAVGSHGISLTHGTAAVADFPRRSSITGNVVDRSTAPTQGSQDGHLIQYSWSGEDIVIDGNVLLGAVLSGQSEGIGWARKASSQSGSRFVVSNNAISTVGQHGIDVPPNSTVTGNNIYRPGSSGIVMAPADQTPATAFAYGAVSITGNTIVEADNANQAGLQTYGINLGGLPTAAVRTVDSLIVSNNIIRDSRGRMDVALQLSASATNFLTNVVIEGNDFSQASLQSVKWQASLGNSMVAGITKLRFRNNLTVDAYSGEGTLAGIALIVRTAAQYEWPELTTIRFGVTRTGIGTSVGALGMLDGVWTPGTRRLTVTAHSVTTATTVVAADLSTFFWEFLGTAA